MNRTVTIASVSIIAIALLLVALSTDGRSGPIDEPLPRQPTPSPTWMFSSIPPQVTTTPTRESAKLPTPTALPEVVRHGQILFYAVGCFHCHGVQAEGAVGPGLARTHLQVEQVIQQVYQPAGDMPVFGETAVSRSDVAAIYAYLQSLKPTGPHPDISSDRDDGETGELLYLFFGCFGCHGYQGEGGFGPPLAGTALPLEAFRTMTREGPAPMPIYPPERVTDEELAHIYAFLKDQSS